MQAAADAASSGMVAIIGLDVAAVQKICEDAAAASGKPIAIANYLVDGNYAISGAKEACEAAKDIAVAAGARMAVPLAVAGAFHTGCHHFMYRSLRSFISLLLKSLWSPR
jgi:[acyl-carrier-protein] S-malonyltransferase